MKDKMEKLNSYESQPTTDYIQHDNPPDDLEERRKVWVEMKKAMGW